jgi:hypothetical protein
MHLRESAEDPVNDLLQSYALLATVCFVLVSAVAAVRLLLLARRTRLLPELLLGGGLLGTAVLGYGVLIAGTILRGPEVLATERIAPRVLQALGQSLHDLGVALILAFVVVVFRPHERWAKVLAGALCASLWIGQIGWEGQNGFRSARIGDGFWWLRYAVIWTYALWPMIESYRYYALMRRRCAIGLADPLVANRFFLWGTGALGTSLATWTSSSAIFLVHDLDRFGTWMPYIQVATATFGVATVAVYYLTFFPPAAYRRWVTGTPAAQ